MKSKMKKAGKAGKEIINEVRNLIIQCVIFILTTIIHHIKVVLNIPTRIGDRLIYAIAIHDSMDGNAWFPAPPVSMADFMVKIQKYEAAAADVKKRKPDAEARLKTAWNEVHVALQLLRNYVEGICLLDPENAEEIALSAGMSIKAPSGREALDFNVKNSASGHGADLSGKVKEKGCFHIWQCSENPEDPMSWYQRLIPGTFTATTSVYDFNPGTRLYFRHKCVTRKGETDWDQVISIIII
jgi:hypothetical protein